MGSVHRIIALAAVAIAAAGGLTLAGAATPASAATAGQCNAYGAVLAGQGMECTVTVDNYTDGVVEYSTVTVQECHGAAFTVLLATECVTTVSLNTEHTLVVTQCNGTLNGGGSNVTCSVVVNNVFSGAPVPALVTHNQCVGSGAGGTSPAGDPLNCSPPGLTLGATVTQCNGSVNGGGGPQRVNCSVPPASETALPVLIDQCNGTVNGGGSVLFCTAAFTNSYNAVGLPVPPVVSSTGPTVQSLTGGTYGTPAGPSLAAGRFIAAAAPVAVGAAAAAPGSAAARAAQLALSGTDATVPVTTAAVLLALGGVLLVLGRRRLRRPSHRLS